MVVYLIDYAEGKQNEKGQVSEDSKKQVNPRFIKSPGEEYTSDEDVWSSGVSREIICPSIGCQSGPDKLIED